MRAAGQAGLTPAQIWHLTPYESRLILQGINRRFVSERNLAMSQAWHTEAFARTKRMPEHKSIMVDPEAKPKDPRETWRGLKLAMKTMAGRRS